MNVGKAIYYLLANNAGVSAITTRIYPEVAPQDAAAPFIVYRVTSVDPDDTHDGPAVIDEVRIEVICVSSSYDQAADLGGVARVALDRVYGTYNTVNVESIQFDDVSIYVRDQPRQYGQELTFIVRVKRDDVQIATGSPIEDITLGRLADVDTTGATDDQVLTYDAATDSWAPEDASTVAALDDLTDVTIDDPIDRQVLAYDEATGQWINDGAGSISIPVYNNLNEEIVAGRPLSAVGAQGDRIKVEPYQTSYGALRFVGIAGEDIPARSNGHATVYGEIRKLDTSNFPVGTLLYPLEGVNENFYPFGLFSWVEGTNANPLVCAIVTRQQQNTGRIFVRMWSPGYRDRLNRLDDVVISDPFQGALLRYDSDQGEWRVPPQTSKSILEGATETVEIYYYSITTDTQQFRSPQSDTPSEGNKIVRKIWYSTTAQEDIDSGTWTLLETLDDNATYLELVNAFEDQLKTSPGGDTPVSIKTTWAEVELFTGLLDTYTGAAAAYSLRRLTGTYTGAAIRVRRDSDDAEQDIGFDSNGDLDTTALATFCSGTDGFVKVWYCQSGNGNDAEQTTTGNQPKIYDSSTGVIEEGTAGNEKPSIQFNGSAHKFDLSVATTASYTLCCVLSPLNSTQSYVIGGNLIASGPAIIYGYVANTFEHFVGGGGDRENYTSSSSIGTQKLLSLTIDSTTALTTYANGTQGASIVPASNYSSAIIDTIGASGTADFFNGNFQEIIIYPSDQSTNRSGIETNINDHYGIYTPFTTGLLDDYSGAAAAYSLRRLSSTYTGPAIRVRRASDNAEQDIEFDIEGNLNTGALASFCSGTDGFVKVWYCQSGNGNDAEQTTTGNQPKIYDSSTGLLVDASGNPQLQTGGGTKSIVATFGSTIAQPISIFSYGNVASATSYLYDGIDATNRVARFTRFAFAGNTIDASNGQGDGLDTSLYNGGSSVNRYNGVQQSSGNAGSNSLAGITIMSRYTLAEGTDVRISELIIYPSNQSANFTAIETNINDYYLIYTP